MDECLILLMLIVVVAALIIFSLTLKSTLVVGAGLGSVLFNSIERDAIVKPKPATVSSDGKSRYFVDDNAKFVIDGHNMIYQTDPHNMNIEKFENNLHIISRMLTSAYKSQKLHIVIKNPSPARTTIYDKLKNSKKANPTKVKKKGLKKSSEERIPYFRELVEFSKEYPRITYHLAYGKDSKDGMHHLKARDDFLTIYLASDGYMVSNDRFRDFSQFIGIKSFKHYSVTNGYVHEKETIKPSCLFRTLQSPTKGNHILFEILDKPQMDELGVKSGEIYLNSGAKFKKMYLMRP